MGTYEDDKYKDGLSGDAPSIFGPGIFGTEEGYKAQQEGYRAFLRNESLIKQAREDREKQEAAAKWSPSDDDYSPNSGTYVAGDGSSLNNPGLKILWLPIVIGFSFLMAAGYQEYQKSNPCAPPKSSAEFPMPTKTCSGLKNSFFEPERGITKIRVPLAKECWTGWVNTPPEWEKWEFQWTGPGGIWIQFLNDKPIWLPPNSSIPFGIKRGIFRASGNGNIFVSLTKN